MTTERIHMVVVNDEEQYSLWEDGGPALPAGWSATGFRGSHEECLAHIEEVWTDMTPRSLRDRATDQPVGNGADG